MYKEKNMDGLFEAYLAVYEENELETRARKNKEALDTGFMKLSDEERKKERERLENLAKRESSRMRENHDNLVLDYLVSEGYADNYDSAACILEAMSDEWLVGILDEKYVKAMDPPKDRRRKGPDHRTSFAWLDPRQLGQNRNDPNREMDPEFFRTRLRQNDKKIDPYYEGNRKRRKERDRARGGFNA
jgi:hypothetical protein